ncbi:MAG: hypothetical protein AAFZ65_10605 [Planctomycetota bacterium]
MAQDNSAPKEFVLVVPRRTLFPTHYPQGFQAFGEADAVHSREGFVGLVARSSYFVERDHAEHEPDLKQVIPYTVVAASDGRVLRLRRTKRGGDARLHDKLSIGVGGHVNPIDAEGEREVLAACGLRELEEELILPEHGDPLPLGLINDDSNPVGAVHVGLAQVLVVDDPARIAIRETDTLEGELMAVDALRAEAAAGANYETWSLLLLDQLDSLLAVGAPVG